MSSNQNLDALLDASIDDLADMPEFAVFPNGQHRVIINWESKVVNDHPSVELKLKMIETVELANPASDSPVAPGTESNVLFMLDNEFGQGSLKALLKPLAENTGTASMRETIAASNGMEVNVVCKIRYNKDKSQSYTSVTKLFV